MPDIVVKGVAVLLAAAAVLYGLLALVSFIDGRGYDRRAAEDAVVMEKQRTTARELLLTLTNERNDNAARLRDLTQQLEKQREISQATNDADLRNRLAGPRLRFSAKEAVGCGRGGPGPESAASAAASDANTAVVQLPEPLNENLLRLVGAAESLKVDYNVLYTFVNNPKLVCELVE